MSGVASIHYAIFGAHLQRRTVGVPNLLTAQSQSQFLVATISVFGRCNMLYVFSFMLHTVVVGSSFLNQEFIAISCVSGGAPVLFYCTLN